MYISMILLLSMILQVVMKGAPIPPLKKMALKRETRGK